ncbi:GNAT superfamily N-acetyltransferase [Catenuloplanes nepalensis]|uniref:GNAT superfamily N-acetyltransferase n=1 Tax=Catenuloplanes nepalensis TaxID=587533 RepID=A0ABT9N0T5_9ACTN|nr:GNAT family N-acetyltransferase [Catenuloplanes nepalensis]MDP9796881.1 GNAT superfamily N-acetyltransferase [Catenuloplanes nepalensis]
MGLWRIRATVDDRPGYLSVLTASLALKSVNILAVQVHTTEGGAVDDFLVDAPDTMSERDLLAAVEKGRGRDPWVAPAEPQALADAPTSALGLAARLVRDPDSLGDALGGMLGATEVTWRAELPRTTPPTRFGLARSAMRLADPAGGVYEIVRHEPAFTPAEYARGQALVEVAAAALRAAEEPVTLLLPDGDEITIRPAQTEDLPGVRGMRACRLTAGPTRAHRLIPHGMVALAGDRVIGLAGLVPEGDIAEVGLLVDDAWRGRGIGATLVRRLVAMAARAGLAALVVHVRAREEAMLSTLERLGPASALERDAGLVTVTLPITPTRAASPAS